MTPTYSEPVTCKDCIYKQAGPDRFKGPWDWYCPKVKQNVKSKGSCSEGRTG
jgi:hypothetical protein